MKYKIRTWLLFGLMVLPFITFGTMEVKKYLLEQQVKGYLTEERGYGEEDIREIQTNARKLTVEAFVVFQDEPEVQYRYQWRKGTINQNGYGLVTGFSKNLNTGNLIHLE
ncbi:DUF3139 domain-containing protein [Pontibacillus salicampi]|uniref:DUF3139 domain-containing protein n=1 Tax=Pontibacillus salicampi TaxID=1449801 RepID=A0ABV6LI64_9BACI